MFQFGLVWFGMMLSLAAVLGQVKQFKASIIIKNVILKSSPHSLPVDGIWQVGLWVTVQPPICMAGVFSSGNWVGTPHAPLFMGLTAQMRTALVSSSAAILRTVAASCSGRADKVVNGGHWYSSIRMAPAVPKA